VAARLSDLVRARDEIDVQISTRVAALWPVLQTELGVAPELMTGEAPLVRVENGLVGVEVPVRVRATEWERERRSSQLFLLPASVLDEGLDKAGLLLRRSFPLACTRCGLVQPLRSPACQSTAKCWGQVIWRKEAPKPRFYIETRAATGYFAGVPARGLRYALDLNTREIRAIQHTLRNTDRWIRMNPETEQRNVRWLEETIGTDLDLAINSRVAKHAKVACLAFDLPDWCYEYEGSQVLRLGRLRLVA
jgi:hypothetical protein